MRSPGRPASGQGCAGLDAPQSTRDVDLEDLVPFFDVDFGNCTRALLPTMHQNMQGSCLLFDMPDGGVALILLYDIQFHETGLAAGFIDLRGQGVALAHCCGRR